MSSRTALKLGATALAAVIVAEGAVWLLRPKPAVEPAPVAEQRYFSDAQIERATDYAKGQRLLGFVALGAEFAALIVLAAGRPAVVRRTLERGERMPLRTAALAGAGISVAIAVVTLPFAIAGHERAVDVGLATQDLGSWGTDKAKAIAIGALMAAAGAALLLALVRRFPRRWWMPASAAVVAIAVIFTWLGPVLLAPLFNSYEKLPPGPVRSEVLGLGRRANVDIGQVYRVDASRRSTALNAYVDGIGSSKRVVLYDNLIEGTDHNVLASVVAHELGHVKGRDVPRGLLWVAIVAPLSLLFVRGMGEAIERRRGIDPGSPAALPALVLAITVTIIAIGAISNQLSRRVETRADTFALELTNDPNAMIRLQRELAIRNVSDPDPPGALQFLFGTHPTTMQRIGSAARYREEQRSGTR